MSEQDISTKKARLPNWAIIVALAGLTMIAVPIIYLLSQEVDIVQSTPTPIIRPQIGALNAIDPTNSDWLKPISGMLLACLIGALTMSMLDSVNGKPSDKTDFIWVMTAVIMVLFSQIIPLGFNTQMERRLAGGIVILLAFIVTLWRSTKGGVTPLATFFASIGIAGVLGLGLGQIGIAFGIAKTPMYTIPDAYRLLVNKSPEAWYTLTSALFVIVGVGFQTAEVSKALGLPALGIGIYFIVLRGWWNMNPFFALLIVTILTGGPLLVPRFRKWLGIHEQSSWRSAFDCLIWLYLVLAFVFVLTGTV